MIRKAVLMTEDSTHFEIVRQQNRRKIRNLMRDVAKIGKSELSSLSGLTFPTISALISDLLDSGEVELLDCTAIRGGRPAGQYALVPLFHTAVCAYLDDGKVFLRVVNVFGQTILEQVSPLPTADCCRALIALLENIHERYPSLSVISLGIPGAVKDGRILFLPSHPSLEGLELGHILSSEFGVTVFIENDVNTLVLAERHVWPNLFHLFRGKCESGSGSGILINGELLRGAGGYAGEIGYLPFFAPRTTQDTYAALSTTQHGHAGLEDKISIITSVIISVICILNPEDVAVSGFSIDAAALEQIKTNIMTSLPPSRCPRLHLVDDIEDLYFSGLLGMVIDYWNER